VIRSQIIKLKVTRKKLKYKEVKVRFMVSEGKGRLFKRKDGKFLIYLPKDLAEDSMFPFKGSDSIFVKISFKLGDNKLM
jgi:hypothetical protein